MNKTAQELGALVRNYRQQRNMTQLELAQKLGYDSTQFVSLFERGLSKIPHNVLGKLVPILGIPERKVMKIIIDDYESELRACIEEGKRSMSSK